MQKEKKNLSTKNAIYRKITLQIGKDFFFLKRHQKVFQIHKNKQDH